LEDLGGIGIRAFVRMILPKRKEKKEKGSKIKGKDKR